MDIITTHSGTIDLLEIVWKSDDIEWRIWQREDGHFFLDGNGQGGLPVNLANMLGVLHAIGESVKKVTVSNAANRVS